MNLAIITQLRNVEDRVYQWINYHAFIGFNIFVLFDDASTDQTINEIKKAQTDFTNINIIIRKTNFEEEIIDNEARWLNNNYDAHLNRQLQSMTEGNNIIKNIDPDAICALIDSDEFIVTENNDAKIIKSIFEENNCTQILIYNFDIKHDYQLNKNFLFENKFIRWDFEDFNKHKIYNGRCKPIIISKSMDICHYIHIVNSNGNTIELRDYNKLRIHHFRIPNLPDSDDINFVEDKNFENTLNEFKIQNNKLI